MYKLLEEYVEEVRSGLCSLPAERREAEVAEIRQHLEAAVDAERHAGLEEDAAVAEALRRFGGARTVRAGLVRAWRREQPSWLASPLGALFVALGTHFALRKLYGWLDAPRLLFTTFQQFDPKWLREETGLPAAAANALVYAVSYLVLVGLPAVVVGSLTGRLSPRRAAAASTLVLLLPLLVNHLYLVATGSDVVRFTLSGLHYRPGDGGGVESGAIIIVTWGHQLWAVAFGVAAAWLMARRTARKGRHEGRHAEA